MAWRRLSGGSRSGGHGVLRLPDGFSRPAGLPLLRPRPEKVSAAELLGDTQGFARGRPGIQRWKAPSVSVSSSALSGQWLDANLWSIRS
mmetsp:Transcript_165253/g.525150  ORF Transcript_165253/g.525150 Transcript_165253/m.525150 type:complete len:89 (-) Transcript_165253:293-559(-)